MRWKKLVITLGYFEAVGMSMVLFYTFLCAYLNDYTTTVLVNSYGEAHVELVLIFVISIVMLVGLFFWIKELKKEYGFKRKT